MDRQVKRFWCVQMNWNWFATLRDLNACSFRTPRRRQAESWGAGQAEVLEARMLLSAVGVDPASLVDAGYYYWAGDKQVPLLAQPREMASLSANDFPAAEFAVPSEFFSADGSSRLWLTDGVYVQLRGASPETVFTADNGFSGYERVQGTTDQYIGTVSAGVAASLAVANSLHDASGIAFAHPNFLVEMWTHSNDPLFNEQWNLHNTGQTGGTADADIDAPEAWAITTGSPNIVVAVLDVGTQLDHPDLVNSLFVNAGEIPGNGIDDDGNGWIDDVHGLDVAPDKQNTSKIEHDGDPSPGNQYDNHGTAVAGVITAEADNGIGISGVAPGAKLMAIRLGEADSSGSFSITIASMAAAVYYAAGRTADGTGTWRGADVANHSYGTGSEIPALTTAFAWAAANGRDGRGLSNFVSSGNGGGNAVSFPASLDTTIAVGASGDNDVRSSYSQYGTALDFVAPGGDGPNNGWVWTTDRTGSDGYGSSDYVGINGTSFSAPTAAGIAALMLSVDPSLTFEEVRRIMRETADRDKVDGVTFDESGFNLEYGYGWLNAEDAVIAAQSFHGPQIYDEIVFQQSDGTWLVASSDGTQFSTSVWANGDSGSTIWGDQVAGDFNGDGLEDVAARNQQNGFWVIGISTGQSFTTSVWGSWTPSKNWGSVLVGDFNGDGRADVAGRIEGAGDGRWFVSVSTGSGFQTSAWGGWTTAKQWGQIGVGDFNGDGRSDIVGRIQNAGDGRWFVSLSNGWLLPTYHFATLSTSVAWGPVHVGDYNGDGRSDIATRIQGTTDGRWFLGVSSGTSFALVQGPNFVPGTTLSHVHIGDFDKDGDDEIASMIGGDGRWYMFDYAGGWLIGAYWGTWSTPGEWTETIVGDFDGDGTSDIAGRNATSGNWQVGLSDGSGFNTSLWGAANTEAWDFLACGEMV